MGRVNTERDDRRVTSDIQGWAGASPPREGRGVRGVAESGLRTHDLKTDSKEVQHKGEKLH